MPLYRTILCAIDFSEHSRRALDVALAIAERSGARVVALHVIEPLLAEAARTAYGGNKLESDTEAELTAFVGAKRAPSNESRIIDAVVRIGSPEQDLVTFADDSQADLIAVGTHGLGGFRRVFFGSVAEKVLRQSSVPVLAVPLHQDDPATPVHAFTGVIAAVRPDESMASVVAHAASLSTMLGLSLTVAHFVPPVRSAPDLAEAVDSAQNARLRDAERHLDEEVRQLNLGTSARCTVSVGEPAAEVAVLSASDPGLLVVIGSGRRPGRRPGTVAYRILHLSSAPVITVPEVAPGTE